MKIQRTKDERRKLMREGLCYTNAATPLIAAIVAFIFAAGIIIVIKI